MIKEEMRQILNGQTVERLQKANSALECNYYNYTNNYLYTIFDSTQRENSLYVLSTLYDVSTSDLENYITDLKSEMSDYETLLYKCFELLNTEMQNQLMEYLRYAVSYEAEDEETSEAYSEAYARLYRQG